MFASVCVKVGSEIKLKKLDFDYMVERGIFLECM